MTFQCKKLQAAVLDWAGTMVDHGSRAPAIVFQEIFRRRGIEITEAQAREPMGMAKRDHIAAIAAMPEVSSRWISTHGSPCGNEDVDGMYEEFLPLQKETLTRHCELIPGAAQAVERCREMGLKIGSSTGYTHELMEIVAKSASEQGYSPDCILCAEDAPRGRPAPYLLYQAAMRLDVYPASAIVKVDDTPVGIEAGRHAGCWTVGVTRTGNCVGLSLDEVAALPADDLSRICQEAANQLREAGAHFTVSSVAELPSVIEEIERQSTKGVLPR